jgi:Mor family transcriptional regulator
MNMIVDAIEFLPCIGSKINALLRKYNASFKQVQPFTVIKFIRTVQKGGSNFVHLTID